MLEKLFKLSENKTSVRTEMLAGLSTFLAMSYIIFVNPSILSQTGMNPGAVFVATCLAATLGCCLMGFLANYPIALAPGMGLNAYFTYSVVLGFGHSWQVALGAVFLSGLIFLGLSIFPIREYMINSIPKSLKLGIAGGIGLFLAIIGFKSAGLITASPATLVTLGNLQDPTVLLAILGFFLMTGLDALGVTGSVILAILIVTGLSIALGYSRFQGVVSMPPDLLPTLLQMDIKGAMSMGLVTIVFAFLLVDLFDNTGTLIAIAWRAGFIDSRGKLPRIGRVLLADSSAAVFGAMLGTSTTTSYVESSVGVKMGGRTGLMAITVGLLFLVALFFAPLAASIPKYATAPALIYVACMMARAFTEIEWEDVTEYVPAMLTAIAMPLTYSIAEGISFGFISYAAIKLLSGRWRDLNAPLVILALAFVAKYAFSIH
ncbi:MAG TPA: NCS2 family permease [Gammaproteobacteria bacterium]|nr:NCS2 family permease [Gammaproteobacteria bacterium]